MTPTSVRVAAALLAALSAGAIAAAPKPETPKPDGAPKAADPKAEARVPKAATKAHRYSPFGTPGETSPEMLAALNRMSEACVVEGRRGSLGHFRWSGTPAKLTHLGLWGAKVGNDLLPLTARLPDLQFVSLYEASVDDAGLAPVLSLPHLRHLAVTVVNRYEKPGAAAPPQWSYPFLPRVADRARVTGKSLAAIAKVAGLEALDLLDVRLAPADLAALTALPKLGSLSLPTVVDAETVKHLAACRRLSKLTLGHREITAEEIARLAEWRSLKSLTLVHAVLTDEALGAFAKLETLEELRLEDCGLTDERLAHLRVGAGTTTLQLDRNEIRGPGLTHLAGSKATALGLEFNNISDATLADLKVLTGVERLGLSYCRGVTDAGIRSGVLQGMAGLKELRLRGLTLVTDASLDDLVKFGGLAHINIRETKISAEGVARMKTAMPKTTVFK